MSLFLYNIIIRLYHLAIIITSSFNPKAKKWIYGRKGIYERLRAALKNNNSQIAWFHCASLGEFEQALPVIEKWKMENGKWKILLTFFSPSGYEIRKDYELADFVFYLPMDGKKNAEKFIEIVRPKIVFFVKYEFWYHYLSTLKKNNIPIILFSAIFRANQLFFKHYGGFYKNMLTFFHHIFVQNQTSYDLLKKAGINNVTIAYDTRFDRVKTICDNKKEVPIVEQFKAGEKLLIIGSSWPEDMKVLIPFINNFDKQLKIIIAPHEINENEIQKIQSMLFQQVNEEDMIYKINEQFNKYIEIYKKGQLQSDVILQLGNPSNILKNSGITNLKITLTQNVIKNKIKKHGYLLDDLKDLSYLINNPIMIFSSQTRTNSKVILIEKKHSGHYLIVAIQLNKKRVDLHINDIRSIYPIKKENIFKWIENGYCDYFNIEKSLKWLPTTEGYNSPSEEHIEDSVANIRKKILKVHEKTKEKHFREEIADCIRYSMATKQNAAKYKVLIIDNIGMLSSLYQYADFAYIGGAFGKGLHNILEAATFGMPIFFGPNYKKFQEAVDLISSGAAFPIKNTKEFEKRFKSLYNNDKFRANKASITRNYVLKNTGAAEKIIQITNDDFRFTNDELRKSKIVNRKY